MRKRLLILIGFTVLFMGVSIASKLSYVITPQLSGSIPTVNVTLSARADKDGIINLRYLDNAWGEVNLYDCIQNIKVSDTGAIIQKLPDSNIIQIQTIPAKHVEISYEIVQDFKGEGNVQNYYRAIINKEYFHLFGHRIYMIPDYYFASKQKEEIEITWATNDVVTQHSFGMANSGTYIVTQEELLESIAVGGDFRRLKIKLDGMDLFFLTRGDWANFTDQDLENTLKDIIENQRAFWNDYKDDIYTITLLPFETDDAAYIGGTGLSKGFASYCSNSRASDIKNIAALYSHEMMHHWIGGKIRNESPSGELWFSEGFTDYFSKLLLTQNTNFSFNKYVSQLNKRIWELKRNPFNEVPNTELALESFGLNADLESIAYLRGESYALYLDQRLFEAYGGAMRLKDLMQIILNDATNNNVRFSNKYFIQLLMEVLGSEEVEAFNHFIIDGNMIPLEAMRGELVKVKFGKVLPQKEFFAPIFSDFEQNVTSL